MQRCQQLEGSQNYGLHNSVDVKYSDGLSYPVRIVAARFNRRPLINHPRRSEGRRTPWTV